MFSRVPPENFLPMTIEPSHLFAMLSHARHLAESPIVIKLGGSAMEDPAATAGTLDSIAALRQVGLRLIVVHGGGKPIDRAMASAGLEVKKVLGRRYTDDAALAIVVKVVREIAVGIVADLATRAAHAQVAEPIMARRLMLPGLDLQPVDLGHVGLPVSINTPEIMSLLDARSIPVLPCIGQDSDGLLYNINADTAAAAVAGAVGASICIFLTDTPGVLRDRHDPASRVPRLTVAECQSMMADRIIDGGMIPKVEACFEALEMGAKKAIILDGRNPHATLSMILSTTMTGTEIVP
jgi:acetylglutamate kinase